MIVREIFPINKVPQDILDCLGALREIGVKHENKIQEVIELVSNYKNV